MTPSNLPGPPQRSYSQARVARRREDHRVGTRHLALWLHRHGRWQVTGSRTPATTAGTRTEDHARTHPRLLGARPCAPDRGQAPTSRAWRTVLPDAVRRRAVSARLLSFRCIHRVWGLRGPYGFSRFPPTYEWASLGFSHQPMRPRWHPTCLLTPASLPWLRAAYARRPMGLGKDCVLKIASMATTSKYRRTGHRSFSRMANHVRHKQ